ncbi:MAG: HTH domain-containing protein [Proteobacteria bacterium]|nr:HTH domain-containing protein [Pseudomonadota bacterium]
MTQANLKNQVSEAASAFATQIVEAVKSASLQELMELQTSGDVTKPAKKKPGPKPGTKRKKPGPKPKAIKAKPGPKPKKAKAAPKKVVTKKAKPAPKKTAKKPKVAAKSKSITKSSKKKLHDDIVVFLKKNPGISGGVICKQFNLNPWTARRQMKQLSDAGKVVIEGEKAKTRYTAKG